MTKDQNESEEKERITMECEHLVPTSMFKGEEVSDEVMMQDEGVDRSSVAGEVSSVSDTAEGVLTSAEGIEQNNACDEMEILCVQ